MTGEIAIRARRAEFNRAIATRDAAAIGPILAKDCVMVTGTDSAVITGRNAQVKVWRAIFSGSGGETYARIPHSVIVSNVEPVAMEQGEWQGFAEGGAVLNSGSYSAKWREVADQWVIEAEIYVTLA